LARYDIYDNPAEGALLLDVQANLLSELSTRVVVPLFSKTTHKPAERLNPVFRIGDGEWVMFTQYLSAIPKSVLKNKVGNLDKEHDKIVAALDMLFQGF
jgi:toxin CcdB